MSNVPRPNPFGLNTHSPIPSESVNPYQAPAAPASATPGSDPEAIRKYYIAHEAGIKSIGTLYMLVGLLLVMCTVVFLYSLMATGVNARRAAFPLATFAMISGTIAAIQMVCFYGLTKLRNWARTLVLVFSCIGLLFFPIGTLINGYFIYLLQSEKANVIFSDAYQDIIRQTPHVRYKTSLVSWFVLALVVLGFIGLLVFLGD